MNASRLVQLLERLTGEPVPFAERLDDVAVLIGPGVLALGYSQLNELLLLAGLDRITHAFFAYLLSGKPEYVAGMAFESLEQLEEGVTRFRKMALLAYGNVKFAFKSLSHDNALLVSDLKALGPVDIAFFESRHEPLLSVQEIPAEDTYLTGYMVEDELKARLTINPNDHEAGSLELKRREAVKIALRNQAAYLASDHLDVYVATSMRARHEFISVGRIVRQIFEHEFVRSLKLRWFDPTQAYCLNRIDKGLGEALMLRRSACTIYLAQESDTLGKDSELASTLAQGKPVIAFVPEVDAQYLQDHFSALVDAEPGKTRQHHLLEQLKVFEPTAAWTDAEVRKWCEAPNAIPLPALEERLGARIKLRYDGRAKTLRDTHPLGIQVNLGTGVANGVLVVRTIRDCAALVRGIITHTLEFELEEKTDCTLLKETISGSVFRVMTSDAMLTNTFWNFYLNPAE